MTTVSFGSHHFLWYKNMFSYYGSKSKIIDYYPYPKYHLIIEPFAGSARYSLKYYTKEVILNDKYEVIYKIWKYLTTLTKEDINRLPNELPLGYDLRESSYLDIEKMFLGFVCNSGVANPHNVVTEWAFTKNEFNKIKKKLKFYEPLIKHWQIFNLDYLELPDVEATWFIDPPYQKGGDRYIEKNIDYNQLAEFCKSRKGQVIVCENSSADWLDFKILVSLRGQKHTTTEVIWQK